MLTLPIKKKWYDMILSGEKKEEYRELKPYYDIRFQKLSKEAFDCKRGYFEILFRNGYSKDSPTIKCRISLAINYGKPEWGAESGKLYYVLKILSVEEVK